MKLMSSDSLKKVFPASLRDNSRGNAWLHRLPRNSGSSEQKANPTCGTSGCREQTPSLRAKFCKSCFKKRSISAGRRGGLRHGVKRVLMVKQPWLDLILAKSKTWEIRGSHTLRRGKIHLGLSGAGGRILGHCSITESFEIPSHSLKRTYDKHRIKDLSVITYERPYAWVLSEAQRYEKPLSFAHPQGAVVWVKL